MVILSNGYKLPEVGDFGDVWFPALEANITRVNSHDHDGSNSSKISAQNIVGFTQNIAAGDFAVDGDRFSVTVILAGGALTIDQQTVFFRDPVTKNHLQMDFEKVTGTQIKIYTPIVRDIEVIIV